ncbi:hypothetical protein PHLCEN_2v4779, partial [Hermanssonia centrifuga]
MFGGVLDSPRSRTGPDYDLLPTSEKPGTGRLALGASRWLKRRRNLVVFLGLTASSILVFFYLVWHQGASEIVSKDGLEILPPLYPEFHNAELVLPQHSDPRQAFTDGKKYLWVADHTQSSGWGNFMQDMMMNAVLVYATGRSYVFDNYTWDRDGGDYAEYNGKKIPSRIPLSALISGPIVGGPFSDDDRTPRAVIKEYWDEICPNKTIVRADEIRKLHGEGATAEKIITTYVDHFAKIEDPCLEVERHSGSIFHIFMFGTKEEMLPTWPRMSQSPILQLFGWGPLAFSAFETNRHLISPAPLIAEYTTSRECLHCVDPYAPLQGLLAMHIRRGDFIDHCVNLGNWGAGFNAFNSFPAFPDQWSPPQGEGDERMAVYMKRCLPTIEQVVEKVEAVRQARSGEGLRDIYIMTNGDREWLKDLKAALKKSYHWDHISTSRDLVLTPEEKYVSQTMDMMIGQRAQVFIGNG